MAQTTRGARQLIELLLADLADIDDAADLDRRAVIFDPQGAYEALVEVRNLVAAMRQRIERDLPPLLERAATNREAAGIPDRVSTLEARVAELAQLYQRVAELAARHDEAPPLRLVPSRQNEG
jgi:hypothetical protein